MAAHLTDILGLVFKVPVISGLLKRDPYNKVVFVCPHMPQDRLQGEDRLPVDLAGKISENLRVPYSYDTPDNIMTVSSLWPPPRYSSKTLFIVLNSNVIDYPSNGNRQRIFVSVHSGQWRFDFGSDNKYITPFFFKTNQLGQKPDVYFEPSYSRLSQITDETTYFMDTLPSRVTKENIAQAALKNPTSAEGRPVIGIMFRNATLTEMDNIVRIMLSLSQNHQVMFLLSTGPATAPLAEEKLEEKLKQIPDCQAFYWHKQNNEPNPYLSILGNATHLVTTGTLSTTSDLLATGKPVYYLDREPDDERDAALKDILCADSVVGIFSEDMLDTPHPSSAQIRQTYADQWGTVCQNFVAAIPEILAKQTPTRPKDGAISTMRQTMKNFMLDLIR